MFDRRLLTTAGFQGLSVMVATFCVHLCGARRPARRGRSLDHLRNGGRRQLGADPREPVLAANDLTDVSPAPQHDPWIHRRRLVMLSPATAGTELVERFHLNAGLVRLALSLFLLTAIVPICASVVRALGGEGLAGMPRWRELE